jgi:catechol 2,3-dioxygenase-like lactoylglutathione lyase family enzyme
MRVRRLDHVLLAMPAGRESDARQFYHGILGIPETTKPADLAGRGGCWFEDGELKIHLGVEKNFVPARKAHPAFLVEDLAGLTSTLRKAGYSISDDVPLEGYNRIFVHDPFGNRIELLEVVPSSS